MVRKMSQSNLKLLEVDQCGDPDYVKQYDLWTIISHCNLRFANERGSVMDNKKGHLTDYRYCVH